MKVLLEYGQKVVEGGVIGYVWNSGNGNWVNKSRLTIEEIG